MVLLPVGAGNAVDVVDPQLAGTGVRLLDLPRGSDRDSADRPIASCPAADGKQLVMLRKVRSPSTAPG